MLTQISLGRAPKRTPNTRSVNTLWTPAGVTRCSVAMTPGSGISRRGCGGCWGGFAVACSSSKENSMPSPQGFVRSKAAPSIPPEEGQYLLNDSRIADDPMVAETGRGHELGAGPRARNRRPIIPADLAVVLIVDHEQRYAHVAGQDGHVHLRPGESEPALEPAAHRGHDRIIHAEQRGELGGVRVGTRRRREEHGEARDESDA